MEKTLSVICLAALLAVDVNATSIIDDNEHPGGWNFELPLLKVKKTATRREVKFSFSSSFSFGFIAGVGQAKDVDIDMGQSFELEWGDVVSLETRIGRKSFVGIGLGFDWRNYRVTGFKQFQKGEQGIISMQDYPEGTEPKFSRIHTFSLSLPVKYYYGLGKHITLGIGPELYFTPYGSLKTRYYMNGEEQKLTAGNVHQNRFSVGIGADIIIHHVGIYYKYNPFPVLRTSHGPKFSTMTVGLKVAF